MTEDIELKFCPFCGSIDLEIEYGFVLEIDGHDETDGYVICKKCFSQGPTINGDVNKIKEKIIKAWNKRLPTR